MKQGSYTERNFGQEALFINEYSNADEYQAGASDKFAEGFNIVSVVAFDGRLIVTYKKDFFDESLDPDYGSGSL